jgi:flavodoxin
MTKYKDYYKTCEIGVVVMNIGIIVHSFTGNTYSVAQKLQEKFVTAGHSANIERLGIVGGEKPGSKTFQMETSPDISSYDALVFGAPVRGFSMSPVIASYLLQLSTLRDKNVICFVTEFFPYPWMGGNRAISQMKKFCESKGAKVIGTGIVNWSNKQRENKMTDMVESLSRMFGM